MKNYYGVDFREQREKLLKSEAVKPIADDIIKKADAAINEEYPALKISEYMLFIETGDRSIFERKYFKRKDNCSYISIAYWLTEDEKYLKPLTDLIFHICDEFTWCVPAHANLHTNPSSLDVIETIDLFQAETARLLTDIAVMLQEKLPYYVHDRIEFEIRRRIIVPMLKEKKFHWNTGCQNNWAAVCAGGVGVAVLHYATDAEIEKILPVLNYSTDNFLKGFNDDGCCLEGYSYWNYGFGYYVIFAMTMLAYSGGKVNMFDNEKVKRIALFPQKVRMGKAKTVSFSDGGNDFSFSPGLFCMLRKIYGTEVMYPPLSLATMKGNVYSVKEFLWFDTEYTADEEKHLTSFFEDSQWLVSQKSKYSFAAKGGHNDEPHNHNDIGSFIIVAGDDSTPLADFGCAVYRRETFDNNLRFTLLTNGSQGHSVPIINGQYQLFGKQYSAKNVNVGEDFFEADIEGAYADGLVKKLHRKFTLKENSVVLCDTVEYCDKTEQITERFVSWTKPQISDGYIDLESAKICFDSEKYAVSVTKDSYRNHADTEDVDAYLIDFEAKKEKEEQFNFEFMMN